MIDSIILVLTVVGVAWVAFALQSIPNWVFEFIAGKRFLMLNLAMGDSMEPAMPEGTTLALEAYPTSVEVGDVVVFRDHDTYIGHRVIEREGDTIVTMGDNCHTTDGKRHVSEVVSKIPQPYGIPLSIPVGPHAILRWYQLRFVEGE